MKVGDLIYEIEAKTSNVRAIGIITETQDIKKPAKKAAKKPAKKMFTVFWFEFTVFGESEYWTQKFEGWTYDENPYPKENTSNTVYWEIHSC